MGVLQICDRVDRAVKVIGSLGALLLIPLIVVIIYDVVSRKLQFIQQSILDTWLYDFMSPTKLQELQWHLHGVIFLTCFGICYLRNAHVRVDVFRTGFSERKQAIVELAGLLVMAIPFMILLVIFGWDFVITSFRQGEGSSALTGIPNRWVIKSFLLLGVVVFLASMLSTAAKLIIYLAGSGQVKADAQSRLSVIEFALDQEVE